MNRTVARSLGGTRPKHPRASKDQPVPPAAWSPGPTNLQEFCELTGAALLLGLAIALTLFLVFVAVRG
jgi:hypothetical protein